MIGTLNRLSKYVKLGVILLLNTFFRLKPSRATDYYDLIIVRSDAIGDFVLWLDTIRSYESKFINKKVLLICPGCDKEIALRISFFSEVVTYNPQKILFDIRYYSLFKSRLKKISADKVILPSKTHQLGADLICSIIKSDHKIATTPKVEIATYTIFDRMAVKLIDLGFVKFIKSYFTNLIELPQNPSVSDFDDNEYFTRRIIDETYTSKLTDLSFIYKDYVSQIEGVYCLISLSSSNILKNWPNERVVKLLEIIPRNILILLSGYGQEDMDKAQYLIDKDSCKHKIINTVNKTTIIDLICLISKASFVLGNDSAAIHIAAACRVPSICYIHGAHFGRYVPYPDTLPEKQYHPRCVFVKMDCFGCGYKCNKDFNPSLPFYCLRQVSIEMVKKEIEKLLNEI